MRLRRGLTATAAAAAARMKALPQPSLSRCRAPPAPATCCRAPHAHITHLRRTAAAGTALVPSQHQTLRQLQLGSRTCSTSAATAAAEGSVVSSSQVAARSAGSDSSGQLPELPGLLDLFSTHGARLTTAAQMVWAQVLQPGDTAVDATCGNGNDTLFMAQQVGPNGRVHAIDLQASAVEATRQTLQQNLPPDALPELQLVQGCHSHMQQLVGSNVAKLVAFNLGYLPGGDKTIITQAGSTLSAVEAALEVVCPGGLVSIMCYIGHPGGLEEYEQVRVLLAGLSPSYWTSSELQLINRPTAPVLLLLWRRPDSQAGRQPS